MLDAKSPSHTSFAVAPGSTYAEWHSTIIGSGPNNVITGGVGGPGGWIILYEPEIHVGAGPDKLVPDLVESMGDAYPNLKASAQRVMDVLKAEEERFYETLANGMEILDATLAGGKKVLPGEVAFKLHDT